VQLNPSSAEAWNNLGIALAANRHPPAAVVAFCAAQRFQPGSPSIHDNLAKALRLAGRNEEATLAAETAAQLRAVARRASP
jgi:Flp pilus assembly protein TadD